MELSDWLPRGPISHATNFLCFGDFHPFFKRMSLCAPFFIHKLVSKVNTTYLTYSSQYWNLMKQKSKKIK